MDLNLVKKLQEDIFQGAGKSELQSRGVEAKKLYKKDPALFDEGNPWDWMLPLQPDIIVEYESFDNHDESSIDKFCRKHFAKKHLVYEWEAGNDSLHLVATTRLLTSRELHGEVLTKFDSQYWEYEDGKFESIQEDVFQGASEGDLDDRRGVIKQRVLDALKSKNLTLDSRAGHDESGFNWTQKVVYVQVWEVSFQGNSMEFSTKLAAQEVADCINKQVEQSKELNRNAPEHKSWASIRQTFTSFHISDLLSDFPYELGI
jgi:hypothetical protein